MTIHINPNAWAEIQRIADRARDNVVRDIANDAQRLAPVDTGQLRSSIRVDGDGVTASSDHAMYVEMGTRHMAAQPYLRPALYRKRPIRGGGV